MKTLSLNTYPSLLIIFLLACTLWTGQYVRRDLWEPDEARYTYVAQEMNRAESWFIPLRNGEPYSHKPPLMFWLIKAGTLVTGGEFNSVSGRLPSLLGAVMALWALLQLGTAWFNRQTAWRGVLVLLTSYLFWAKGGMGQIDMLLLGLEMSALALLFSSDKSPDLWRYIGAFCLMGLGILAKGPVGLIVPAGIYISVSLATGNGRKIIAWHWLWGIGLALLFPLAWLLLAKLGGAPDSYFDEILFKQNVGRMAGKFGSHVRPFYYYAQYLLIDFLPWTFLVPGSLLLLLRQPADRDRVKALLAWMAFVVLFFTLSSSKRNLYILSVYPAASLLVAAALPKLSCLSRKWQLGTVIPMIGLFSTFGLALLIVPWLTDLYGTPRVIYPPLAGLLLVGSFLLFRQFKSGGLSTYWVYLAIGIFFAAELYVGIAVMPALNAHKTPVQLAEAAMRIIPEQQPLLLYRMNGEIFALYSHRRGQRIDEPEALLAAMQATDRGIAVFTQKGWEQVSKQFAGMGKLKQFTMGSKDLCWLEYGQDPALKSLELAPATEGSIIDEH